MIFKFGYGYQIGYINNSLQPLWESIIVTVLETNSYVNPIKNMIYLNSPNIGSK